MTRGVAMCVLKRACGHFSAYVWSVCVFFLSDESIPVGPSGAVCITCGCQVLSHWNPLSHPRPLSHYPSESHCRSWKTGLLPLRQTPSRSQVELPVTMRQPLETDGLQTACHVYCCCHKRQESNNTLPQEPHGIAQGPANSCLGGGRGGRGIGPAPLSTHAHTHLYSHLELTPTSTTIQMPLLPNT